MEGQTFGLLESLDLSDRETKNISDNLLLLSTEIAKYYFQYRIYMKTTIFLVIYTIRFLLTVIHFIFLNEFVKSKPPGRKMVSKISKAHNEIFQMGKVNDSRLLTLDKRLCTVLSEKNNTNFLNY